MIAEFEPDSTSSMAVTFQVVLPQCRLLLRKSSVTFAERKTTLSKMIGMGS